MSRPYHELPDPETPRKGPILDPWLLALLFAWVCGVARIGVLVIDHKPYYLEVAFAGLLAVISVVAGVRALRAWRKRRG
jgi:hypothetical protein